MTRPDDPPTAAAQTTEFPKSYIRGVAPVAPRSSGRGRTGLGDDTASSPAWARPSGVTPTLPERSSRWRPGGAAVPAPRPPLRQLRRGGQWTWLGALTAFVCWGIWAISVRDGDLAVPVLAFVIVLLVAGGLFVVSRLLGRVVFERTMGRTRRTAWPSHLVVGVFLIAAGLFYLRQTDWVVDAWTWLRALR